MATLSPYNFGDLSTPAGLTKLDTHLENCSYLSGYTPSKDDLSMASMVNPTHFLHTHTMNYPHICRWYKHITFFPIQVTKNWPQGKLKTPPTHTQNKAPTKATLTSNSVSMIPEGLPEAKTVTPTQTTEELPEAKTETPQTTTTPTKKEEESDDIDLFGDDDDEEAAEEAKKLAVKKKAEKEALAGKKKKEVINKSTLVIEVKPNNEFVNLDNVKEMIHNIQMEGLTWGEAGRKVPLAFGLYKLQVNCTIVDDLVNTESILDLIEILGMNEEQSKLYLQKKEAGVEDSDEDEDEDEDDENSVNTHKLVQSAEIISFNKV